MNTGERRVTRLLTYVQAGDIKSVLDVALEANSASQGFRGAVWGEVLDALRGLSPDVRMRIALDCPALFSRVRDDASASHAVLVLLATICPGLPDDQLVQERRAALDALGKQAFHHHLISSDVLAEAELAAGRELTPPAVAAFRRSAAALHPEDAMVALAKRLTEPVLNVGEPWAERVLAELPELGDGWRMLVEHALTATAAKPSARWEKTGRALLEALRGDSEPADNGRLPGDTAPDRTGDDPARPVRGRLMSWLALVGRPRTIPLDQADANGVFDPYNATAMRGLVWLLSFLPPHPDAARALGALTETSLRKVPGIGPRSPKVANACVVALSRMDSEAALAELARLTMRITHRGTQKLLDTTLETRARALGLGKEEIQELAVPSYGLTEVGEAIVRLGEATAVLRIREGRAAVNWYSAAGTAVKGAPAAARREYPEKVKELKAAVNDINKMLTAQTERLDQQFLARRSWPYAVWRERYLEHPLVGTLARRLLWVVDGQTCGFADGALRTVDDAEPETPAGDAPVELWHPVGRHAADVMAWRDWLERHGITQPFKQAHREVYVLTDAERRTGTYSNRFAAHILRQHQFHALAAVRGWVDQLRLAVNDWVPPTTRELPQWGLRAEFWVTGDGTDWGVDTTESGTYLRLRTDQVRFYPADAPQNVAEPFGGGYSMSVDGVQRPTDPLPLSEIPALVLSEVLRDVDLFVGVASVGNDPTWQDGGPGGRFLGYWASYSFGELDASAETRRDLLTRLLPRLAIGGQCTIEGRFLQVKGTRHTYRIHLRSGNVMISPEDRYLCIVPSPSDGLTGLDPYLPFDGDRTLSLILSKAMLLVRDDKITDPTILSQL
ncbi:DUF4132 domain-containing protein [Streptomyces sp. NPDC087659]|uniref:DUF4132 domain-containing protein n=1 Tax=Streptomyces sp. NPDC087659 TaxID=3365801 RepID=UPI00380794BE